MIIIPAVITLAISVLRLVGELQNWPTRLFNPAAGGDGAIVGISWLPPIFGIYFALRLYKMGFAPEKVSGAIWRALLGLAIMMAGAFLSVALFGTGNAAFIISANVSAAIALVVQASGWPELFKVLLAYGYAARIPVLIIMFFAIRGSWGTHYDAPPPGFPEMSFWPKYFLIGVLPQLIIWIAFTVVLGSLFGSIAAALARRKHPTPQTA
jgi:hypothetical protein